MTLIQFWWNRRRPVKTQNADRFTLTRFRVGAQVRYVNMPNQTLPARIIAIGADAACGEATLEVVSGYARTRLSNCFFNPHTRDAGTWHWE